MPDLDPAAGLPGEADQQGTTRRGMLRGAAGLGAAGLAATLLAGGTAAAAGAATADPRLADENAPAHEAPVVAHVHDAKTGVVDLFTGTRHVQVTDPQLAARLARAAR